jgi:tetratricopeptide (TPR) repeat protein
MKESDVTKVADEEPAPRLGAGPDRLDSWKEIASYLNREVRTVQMWEKKEGLPVHRHFHSHLGTVFAFRSEIEAWGKSQAAKQVAANKSDIGMRVETARSLKPIRIDVTPFQHRETGFNYPLLCKMLVSETIDKLRRLDQSKVQVLPDKESRENPTRIIRQADYKLIWDGRAESNGLVIKASLIQTKIETVVWSRAFHLSEKISREIPALIADQIVQCLWLKIVCLSRLSLTIRRVEKTSSREAYLKGRFFLNQRNEAGMRKAISWFRTAIYEDPTFALPYSGLADSLTLLAFYEIESPSEAMPEARSAALKAIDLAPNVAEAHASLADIHLHFDRDWEGADQEYRRAIQCNPEYALGYHWYANLLSAKGQHEAAQIAIMQALEIDPVSLITQVWAGVTCHLARRFDEAIKHYQSALELDPHYTWAHMYMALALEQKEKYQDALREFETTIQLTGGSSCVQAMKAHTFAAVGDKVSARAILRTLREIPNHKCMPSYDIAATYAALGESSQVAKWLKRACNERNMKLFKLQQDPRFDGVRHCPEFQEVVSHVGLARYEVFEVR